MDGANLPPAVARTDGRRRSIGVVPRRMFHVKQSGLREDSLSTATAPVKGLVAGLLRCRRRRPVDQFGGRSEFTRLMHLPSSRGGVREGWRRSIGVGPKRDVHVKRGSRREVPLPTAGRALWASGGVFSPMVVTTEESNLTRVHPWITRLHLR